MNPPLNSFSNLKLKFRAEYLFPSFLRFLFLEAFFSQEIAFGFCNVREQPISVRVKLVKPKATRRFK